MSRATEEWREVPNFDGWYQVSDWGRVRSFVCSTRFGIRRSETPHLLRVNTNCRKHSVWVVLRKDGQETNVSLLSLVATVFLGGVPKGMVPYRKTQNTEYTSAAWNIGFRKAGSFIASLPPPHRRPVVKMNDSFEVVAVYGSAMDAAKQNFFHHTTVRKYCDLKNKSILAADGYIYAWDDERWLRKLMKRAKLELGEKGLPYTCPDTGEYWNVPVEAEPDETGLLWEEALPIRAGAAEDSLTE